MNLFKMFHAHRRLVLDGKANSISCPQCETPLVTMFGGNDYLELWCAGCDTTYHPGLDVIENVRAIVLEWYDESDLDSE